jgi:type IV pilus assembly protein PilY1
MKKLIIHSLASLLMMISIPALSAVELSDKPLLSGNAKGNVALALSVEFPTGIVSSYAQNVPYSRDKTFYGYFDPEKCYAYVLNDATADNYSYFDPIAKSNQHSCKNIANGRWSGNFLNWATSPALDSFRSALTGGYRLVDKPNITVLEKANSSTFIWPSFTPNKSLTNNTDVADSTPYAFSNIMIRTYALNGAKLWITSTGNIDNPTDIKSDAQLFSSSSPNLNEVYYLYARVRVCKPTLLESNCKLYPNGDYKPTGVIQKYAHKLNFAAFGYLNDDTPKRDGGVLRARMSSIGPDGDYPEWDANTGILFKDPNPADSAASGLIGNKKNSGVINYLNKFGLNGYKTVDPVSELYYAVGRYFRNKGNVTNYSDNLTDVMKDDFPVITTWDDPIKSSCEANFILGIGDTNTNNDSNLPRNGNMRNDWADSDYTLIREDEGDVTNNSVHKTDAKFSTDYVGNLQGITDLGSKRPPWFSSNNSFFMAGIAYDLHTRDIRPGTQFTGKQTVKTYWFDTLERETDTNGKGDRKGFGGDQNMRNQFWLAAKYGGFTVPSNYDPYGDLTANKKILDDKSNWDTDNDINGDPDTYFRANEPGSMIKGLNKAFQDISVQTDATSSDFSLASPQVFSDSLSFSAKYASKIWTGTVIGNTVTFDSLGNPVTNKIWSTDDTTGNSLTAQASGTGWNTNRFIATANCTANTTTGEQTCTGVPFRYNNLSTSAQTALNSVDTLNGIGDKVLDYLRGDKTNENTMFRSRSSLLGDIVNGQILAVGAPKAKYSETTNQGYTSFKNTYKNRQTVAYVGANDGMLHAFNGQDGKELFAYVPHALFKGPNHAPFESGLAALADPNYSHHFYVDSTPALFDVKFSDNAWHSLLIGGLGKGGKAYYALDVTNPSYLSNETNLANAVRWEFTHKDLGFSYGRPVVVKADNGQWIVILTSGYNNVDGIGYFFIVDAQTGKLLNKVSTGVGNTSHEAGLANVTAFVNSAADFTADAAYAGDLLGNVWRLDLAGITSAGYSKTPTRIAQLKSASGVAQPITTSPVVEYDQKEKKRTVFVGTGKLVHEKDIGNNSAQSFYAIYDGTNTEFYTASTLPSPVNTFPINPRAVMVNHTDKLNSVTTDINKPMGYFIDLTAGFQINVPMSSAAGAIAFGANKITGDFCNISTKFRGYALSYATGISLLSNNGVKLSTQYYEGNGTSTSVQIYKQANKSNPSVNFSSSDLSGNNANNNISFDILSTGGAFQLLNWRAVPNRN